MKILVLGGGLVGGEIALDLATEKDLEVRVADLSDGALERLKSDRKRGGALKTEQADLSDPEAVGRLCKDADIVVGAVPGFLGYKAVEAALRAGADVVDISFFPEDGRELDALAKEKGRVLVLDCGVAPGISHLLVGRLSTELEPFEEGLILVGGLPVERKWPYEYKLTFSPLDVLEEYTRPARVVENGRELAKEALSEVELVDFDGLGTLEAFNSDGLRSLLHTVKVGKLAEKTLRYPGHTERMRMLRETGYFSHEPVQVDGRPVRPVDLTARLLFPMWKLQPGEEDFLVMRVTGKGKRKGRETEIRYEFLDRYDRELGVTAMARTTGYTCAAAVRMLARGKRPQESGAIFPEEMGRDSALFAVMVEELEKKGIRFKRTEMELEARREAAVAARV